MLKFLIIHIFGTVLTTLKIPKFPTWIYCYYYWWWHLKVTRHIQVRFPAWIKPTYIYKYNQVLCSDIKQSLVATMTTKLASWQLPIFSDMLNTKLRWKTKTKEMKPVYPTPPPLPHPHPPQLLCVWGIIKLQHIAIEILQSCIKPSIYCILVVPRHWHIWRGLIDIKLDWIMGGKTLSGQQGSHKNTSAIS